MRVCKKFSVYGIYALILFLCLWHIVLFIFLFMAVRMLFSAHKIFRGLKYMAYRKKKNTFFWFMAYRVVYFPVYDI